MPRRVAVVQTTEHGLGRYFTAMDRSPDLRRFPIERLMRPRRVVVLGVLAQSPQQVPLAERDDVVQALSPDASDHALHERILPRRSWR